MPYFVQISYWVNINGWRKYALERSRNTYVISCKVSNALCKLCCKECSVIWSFYCWNEACGILKRRQCSSFVCYRTILRRLERPSYRSRGANSVSQAGGESPRNSTTYVAVVWADAGPFTWKIDKARSKPAAGKQIWCAPYTMGGDTVWMIIYGKSPPSSRRGAVYLHRKTGGVDRLSSRAASQIASQTLLKVDLIGYTAQLFTLPSAYTNNVHGFSICCN